MLMNIIYSAFKKIFFENACWSGEGSEPAWTFRAPKIAARGRFKRNGNRQSPLYRFFQ